MFRELTEVEKIKIDGGNGFVKDYIKAKIVDKVIGAAINYAKNPYPVGSGCSELE